MKKYKQKFLPSVNTPDRFNTKTRAELEAYVSEYYKKHVQGRSVINKHLGYTVSMSGKGLRKITRGSALYPYKAIAVKIIDKLIEYAEYSSFGPRKNTDPVEVAGYLNFKVKCLIDGKREHLRIATILYKDSGKIYFNHEVNKKGA